VAVAIDASTPAAVKSDTAVSSLTTAAFTPPIGAVLLMVAIFDTATSTRVGTPSTVTGSTATWTTVANYNNGNGTTGGLVHISWTRVTASASTTVRVTWPASNDCALKVWVLTGAPSSGSPIGATGNATYSSNPQTVSYTSTATGSQGFIGLEDFSQAGGKTISNTTSEIALSSNSNGNIARDSSVSTATGQTRSFTISGATGSASVGWVEVIPASGGGGGGGGGGTTTGGSGGPLTDRTSVSYTNTAGITSTGHIYAAGLDWNKNVGVLIYTDGSAEFGLKNTSSTYLLAGTNGLIAKAKAQNMILVTPLAPGNGCTDGDGTCWYLPSNDGTTLAAKIKWADDFIQNKVLSQYNIDITRVVIAGYSSGAQFTMEYYGPQYSPSWMQDGLLLGISYGGSPKVTVNYTTAFKAAVAASWDVGGADPYGYNTDPSYDAQSGYNWYSSNGFATTELTVVPGVTHDRDGTFGGIVDREATQYVAASTANATDQTVYPAAIDPAETFGVPTVAPDQVVATTGVASGEALGVPTVAGDQIVTATAIASGEAFGGPVVALAGADQAVVLAGIVSSETFGIPLASLSGDLGRSFTGFGVSPFGTYPFGFGQLTTTGTTEVGNLTLYSAAREGFLDGSITWSTATIQAALVRGYTFSDTDRYVSDVIAAGGSLVSTVTLINKTVNNGIADASDVLFSAVAAGPAIPAILLFQSSAAGGGVDVAPSAQRLVGFTATATGLPAAPNGQDISVIWSNDRSRIFML
jgi:hypothetical protein